MRGQTDLRLGIEADFVPGAEDRIANVLQARDFDYVVGSVHFLRDGAVDMDDYSVWDAGRSPEEVWTRYFQTIGETARCGLFDILAHPDLVKYWGDAQRRPEGDLRRYYEPAIEGIAESGIAVELSTAGLRKKVGEMYPAPAFLEMAIEAGAPIALSSDAHRPRGHRRGLRSRPGSCSPTSASASWPSSSTAPGALSRSRTGPEPGSDAKRDRLRLPPARPRAQARDRRGRGPERARARRALGRGRAHPRDHRRAARGGRAWGT